MAADSVTMVMVGDVYVQRSDPWSAFAPIAPYLSSADVGFCNLETVIADASYLDPDDHDQRPRTDESILPVYLEAGFNVFNIANNPTMYHGLRPFARQLDVLDQANLTYGGGGRNLAAARKPAIMERNGTRIAFVCRTSVGLLSSAATASKPGVARFGFRVAYEPRDRGLEVPGSPPLVQTFPNERDLRELIEDIHAAREQADTVVVSWHWGVSPASGGTGDIVSYQVEMGRLAIDSGADLVVGHHPHVLQAIEVYRGKPVVYSLGNYVHDMGSMGHAGRRMSTMLVRCGISGGRVAELSYVPGLLEGNGPPRFLKPAEAPAIVDYMAEISEPYGTRFQTRADDVAVLLDDYEPRNVLTREGPIRAEAVVWRRAAGV
ncbi:MAG TPA: CapA family protein [Chloroflexota bacterium]|nr:CapA family protein [Chloroflexota bacterium]